VLAVLLRVFQELLEGLLLGRLGSLRLPEHLVLLVLLVFLVL
jgi:hypothetical protein